MGGECAAYTPIIVTLGLPDESCVFGIAIGADRCWRVTNIRTSVTRCQVAHSSIEDDCDGTAGILIGMVVSEPQRAPSMRAFRFLRDSRSSGLFNPVSPCRAISQRLPEPASRRKTCPEDRTRLGLRRGPRSNLANERNETLRRPAMFLDTTVRSLWKVGSFYILIVLLSFRAQWKTARACRRLSTKRGDCRVDPQRGDFIRCPTCVSGCLDNHRSRRLSSVGLSSSLLGFRDPDLDRSCCRPVLELLA